VKICKEEEFVTGSQLAREWQPVKGHVRSKC